MRWVRGFSNHRGKFSLLFLAFAGDFCTVTATELPRSQPRAKVWWLLACWGRFPPSLRRPAACAIRAGLRFQQVRWVGGFSNHRGKFSLLFLAFAGDFCTVTATVLPRSQPRAKVWWLLACWGRFPLSLTRPAACAIRPFYAFSRCDGSACSQARSRYRGEF